MTHTHHQHGHTDHGHTGHGQSGQARSGHEQTGHEHAELDASGLADLLDLDGVVLREYWTDALTWLRRAADHLPRRRLLDVGAGSGVGTIALAQRFAGAQVIAVDQDERMLDRLRGKALDLGLAPRVRTVHADLDAGLPALEPVDLSWASMSMHHFADPDRVLAELFAATRPGGLLAVAEFSEPLRFLPEEFSLPGELGAGRPGLEDRLLTALNNEHAQSVPELGADWPPRLVAAGFDVLEHRRFQLDLRPGRNADSARYAQLWFARLRSAMPERLDGDDLAVLDLLLGDGPHSLRHRDDLHLHGVRTITLARRD